MSPRREESRLYDLLPSYIRFRDAYEGKPLLAVMEALELPYRAVERDLVSLYDGWFIETCDLWRVPYIGALLGVRGLGETGGVLPSQRNLVANTLAYRRAKGTAAALERAATDVTGWPCHLIPYRETTAGAPPLVGGDGREPGDGTVDLRREAQIDDLDTPWNTASHSADVKPVASGGTASLGPRRGGHGGHGGHDGHGGHTESEGADEGAAGTFPPLGDDGGYRPAEVGLVFHRLGAMPVEAAQARPVVGGETAGRDGDRAEEGWRRYRFRGMGVDGPLFNPQRGDSQPLHLSRRDALPAALAPRVLRREIEARRAAGRALAAGGKARASAPATAYLGEQPALRIVIEEADGPRELTPEELGIADLAEWALPAGADGEREEDGEGNREGGPPRRAWVDPVRGRFLLAPPPASAVGAEVESETTETGADTDSKNDPVWVDYHVGAALDLGGGSYPREPLPPPGEAGQRWSAVVSASQSMGVEASVGTAGTAGTAATAPAGARLARERGIVRRDTDGHRVHCFRSLDAALRAWNHERVPPIPSGRPLPRSPRNGVIRILDSGLYPVGQPIDLRGRRLLLQAADGCTPTLVGDLVLRGPERRVESLWESDSRAPSLENQLALDGLWVDGGIEIVGDTSLTVRHSTVVPTSRPAGEAAGSPKTDPSSAPGSRSTAAIRVRDDVLPDFLSKATAEGGSGPAPGAPRHFTVRIHHSIVAGLDLGERKVELGVAGSLIDGPIRLAGGEAQFARSTVFGELVAGRLPLAVDTLFAGPLWVEFQGGGRLRTCWLPEGSRTPPRERCVEAPPGVGPELFRATRYGDPAYGMLATAAPRELLEGASNGNEIGVFNALRQSDRLANLDTVLAEYLPVGMSARVWLAT